MKKPDLADLNAFAAVARHRSFKRAADELGLSPSAVSHLMRALERRLGVRLLHRTTRSVSLTEPGEHLLARLAPALRDVDLALEELDPFRGSPSGTVRINAPEAAARLLLERVVPAVLERYPEVAVDIVAEGRLVDIVAEGFDAGVRLGESVPQDMIGVRFGGEVRFLAVASPGYLARSGVPHLPDDLRAHACIRHRMPSGKLYRWEFERHGEEIRIDVPGRLTLDRIELMVEAAERGLGIAYVPEHAIAAQLTEGTLRPVLEDWCPPIPGLILYYPGRRHLPGSLRAFIDTLREVFP
ncbi:LysR family transcriptional regulator [Mesorhizobium sp. RMAD-H1]|uniref:LysR family transcriptional regulator n=1 Tax=Mesorhizobium sp. RMAD-H1 TaxID=2587065 RepID=UPI001616C0EB|nr:LysR family transcriptional regulator [Mesorhizobium sp. RMAD-H1]MBB2970958.1 DNA-binding transcriptional LysR family regulator [Mesorhizobium sp. RMAD-H1]